MEGNLLLLFKLCFHFSVFEIWVWWLHWNNKEELLWTQTSKQLKLSFCWVLWSSLLSVFPAAAWLCSVNVAWIISELRTEQRFQSFSGKYGDQFGLHCSLKPIQLWEENLILDQTASSGPDTSVRRLYKIMSSLDF